MLDEGGELEVAEVDGWGCDISAFAGFAISILVMLRMLDPGTVSTLRIIWDMDSSSTDMEHGYVVGDTVVVQGYPESSMFARLYEVEMECTHGNLEEYVVVVVVDHLLQ